MTEALCAFHGGPCTRSRTSYEISKRALDVAASTSLLAVLSPLLGVIAGVVKRDDGGPVLYRGVRSGRNGRPFVIYKFRTMVPDAERLGGPSTSNNDARLTKSGRFLRRWKLDELPQLFNVLKGDMSLVGPRPQVVDEVSTYTEAERHLLLVRPGITDWASVCFRDEGAILAAFEDPDCAYATMIRPGKNWLALQYVEQASLKVDMKILFATVLALFGRTPPLPDIPEDVVERLGLERATTPMAAFRSSSGRNGMSA